MAHLWSLRLFGHAFRLKRRKFKARPTCTPGKFLDRPTFKNCIGDIVAMNFRYTNGGEKQSTHH